MNKIISQSEISTLSDMNSDELNIVIAQMVSLTNVLVSGKNDIDSMVEALEKQPWYKRMLFTLIGKNKATKEEIVQKKDQISVYTVQAIGTLYEMGKVHEDIISSLGQKINDIYYQITLNSFEQIMIKDSIINLKDMVETITVKLNNKIEKVDSFTMLNEEIKQGIYNDDNAMVSVCGILSHINIDVLKDERKMEIIKRSISEMNVFSNTEKPLIAFMNDVAAMPIDKTGMAYLELSSMSDNLFASIFSSFMEKYNMLPKIERMAKDKGVIIKKIVDVFDINADAEFSPIDLFNAFVDSKCENSYITYINNSSLSKDNDTEVTYSMNNSESQSNELEEQCDSVENDDVENENYVDIDAIVDEIMEAANEPEEQEYTADIDSIFEYDEETSIPNALTEITLSSIMQIKEDEVKTFSYNIIHINTNINCEGTLNFKNCVIYYNDSGSPSGIQLERTSSVRFFNCKIVMTEERETEFIKGDANAFLIKDTTFKNCANLCKINIHKNFLMDSCYVYNCYKGFVYVRDYARTEMIVNNCVIIDGFSDSHFTEFYLLRGKINNITVIGYKSSDENRYTSFFEYLSEANKCTFINAENCLKDITNVTNCQFLECNNAIKVHDDYNNNAKINNCFFKKCGMTIENADNTDTTVSYCQFLECYCPNIASYSRYNHDHNSINIEYCEFINVLSYNIGNSKLNSRIPHSFIAISRQNNKESKVNTISNCIFNGVQLGNEYLIEPLNPAGSVYSLIESRVKPNDKVIVVRNCSFMNCASSISLSTSIKKDLIKMQVQYDTLFKKDLSFSAVYTYDCSGLKDVNKGGCQTDNYVVKETNTSGEPIGSSFANTYTVDELKDPTIVQKAKIGAYMLAEKFDIL